MSSGTRAWKAAEIRSDFANDAQRGCVGTFRDRDVHGPFPLTSAYGRRHVRAVADRADISNGDVGTRPCANRQVEQVVDRADDGVHRRDPRFVADIHAARRHDDVARRHGANHLVGDMPYERSRSGSTRITNRALAAAERRRRRQPGRVANCGRTRFSARS
jgi:hypothetical protein